MNTSSIKTLNPQQISRISSVYLTQGRKQDVWEITHVEVEGDLLRAKIRMQDYFRSPTDNAGFHLTSFSTLEFLSQLFIIWGHVTAGLEEKTQEGWMMESAIVCEKAIRDPENIQVEMHFEIIKKIRNRMMGTATARVFDQHGVFTAKIKALLA